MPVAPTSYRGSPPSRGAPQGAAGGPGPTTKELLLDHLPSAAAADFGHGGGGPLVPKVLGVKVAVIPLKGHRRGR
jgi:hypothetical protein